MSYKPAEGATCEIINGKPTWVVNDTLVVNGTISVNENLVVAGNFTITGNSTVLLTSGATITVFGCPMLGGSLDVKLNSTEVSLLDANGYENRTILIYDQACGNGTQFDQVTVSPTPGILIENYLAKVFVNFIFPFLDCAKYLAQQENSPGLLVVLLTSVKLVCNSIQPSTDNNNTSGMPDWAIGTLVAGLVALSGGVTGLVLGLRKQKLKKEFDALGAKMKQHS